MNEFDKYTADSVRLDKGRHSGQPIRPNMHHRRRNSWSSSSYSIVNSKNNSIADVKPPSHHTFDFEPRLVNTPTPQIFKHSAQVNNNQKANQHNNSRFNSPKEPRKQYPILKNRINVRNSRAGKGLGPTAVRTAAGGLLENSVGLVEAYKSKDV